MIHLVTHAERDHLDGEPLEYSVKVPGIFNSHHCLSRVILISILISILTNLEQIF